MPKKHSKRYNNSVKVADLTKGGATKLIERHPLVQFLQDPRMRCLQSHCYFQLLPAAAYVSRVR